AYVIGGEGYFEPTPDAIASARERDGAPRPTAFGDGSFVAYEAGGDTVTVTTESSPVRFLLIAGKPLRERVAWYGPVVMNTQAELQTAFRELNEGTFIKHKPAV